MNGKRDTDTDHPSEMKCNQPDCQKLKCWYAHKTQMPTSKDVINQQDIPKFIYKKCQKIFIDINELMHHRKREHSSHIVC